jgi:hypothetical protein
MGVIKHFSSSSHDKSSSMFSRWLSKSSADNVRTETKYESLPNPRPDNYEIIRSTKLGKFLVIEIKYLDCINYEGKKILVFENCSVAALKKQQLIDPHFSENKKFISPIARFEPTNKGWDMALKLIRSMTE